MLAIQSVNFACTDFLKSVFGANGRWNPAVRSWCGHGFLTQPEFASQSAGTLEKLLGNRFCDHGKTRTEKNGKNLMERYGIPNVCRFRKSLATSTLSLSKSVRSWPVHFSNRRDGCSSPHETTLLGGVFDGTKSWGRWLRQDERMRGVVVNRRHRRSKEQRLRMETQCKHL